MAIGAKIDMSGVPRNAMSRAFFSDPPGRRERRDGTINSHHHQNPRTLMEVSLIFFHKVNRLVIIVS